MHCMNEDVWRLWDKEEKREKTKLVYTAYSVGEWTS